MSGFSSNATTEKINNIVDYKLALSRNIFYSGMDFIYAIVIPIITFGLVANVLNIVVYIKTGVRDNVTISFLALSFSDLFYLMTISIRVVPLVIYHFLIFRHKKSINWLVDRNILIFPFYWYALLFYETSILITVYIAVVRCACVTIPFKVKTMFTARRAVIVFIAFFLFIFFLRLPMFLKQRIVREFDPVLNRTRLTYKVFDDGGIGDIINDIVNRNVLNFGSMITVTVCLFLMGYKLQASAKFRSSAGATRSLPKAKEPGLTEDKQTTSAEASEKEKSKVLSTKETRVLRSVILVSVVFVACQAPAMSYTLARRIISLYGSVNVGFVYWHTYLLALASRSSTVFSVINASVNIFAYFNFNSRYRETLKSLWKTK